MIKMLPPLGHDKNGEIARRVFCECIEGYRLGNPKRGLAKYAPLVLESAVRYEQMIPREIESFPCGEGIPNQEKRDLQSVYGDKFSKKGSPGRCYYDRIKQSAPRGACPICGIRDVSCVDHYLPKKQFPLLSVVPSNLIPICSSCNDIQKKGDYCGRSFDEMLLHPYFDELPTSAWMIAKLDLSKESFISFCVKYPLDAVLEKRLTVHFEIYDLNKLYSIQAMSELDDMKWAWYKQLDCKDESSLISSLERILESARRADPLSWRTALYQALVSQYNELANWLRKSFVV